MNVDLEEDVKALEDTCNECLEKTGCLVKYNVLWGAVKHNKRKDKVFRLF